MSTSIYVLFVKPPDERWQQMKTIYDTCTAAGVPVPREVVSFFEGDTPDPSGVIVRGPSREWSDSYRSGLEIDVSDIPSDVKTVRFVVSW